MTFRTVTDHEALGLGAAGLLTLAGILLWQHLQLPLAHALTVASVALGSAAALGRPRQAPAVAPLGLVLSTIVGGVWYLVTRTPDLLVGLVTTLVATAFAIRATSARRRDSQDAGWSAVIWAALAIAAIAASWAVYFQLFTVGIAADHIARRLILTLVWAGAGVGLVVAGRLREAPPVRGAGWLLVAAGCAKAVFYDTSSLPGGLRVTSLVLAGLLLAAGAVVLTLRQRRPLPAA